MIYLLILYFIPILFCCIWARIDKNFITDSSDLILVILPILNWCLIWSVFVNNEKLMSMLYKIITGRNQIY